MTALRKLISLARQRPTRAARRARLYRRPDCHLCEEAVALVESIRRRGLPIELESVDIESDPALLRRYLLTIPVLELEDGPALEWPFTRSDLERALR
jgi:hypothetical protein